MVQMNGLTRVVLCAQEQCPPTQKRQSAWRLPLYPATEATQNHSTVHVRAHLVVGGAEAPAHVLVVEHLHLEREVLLQLRTGGEEEAASAGGQCRLVAGTAATHVLDDHDEERQLDA